MKLLNLIFDESNYHAPNNNSKCMERFIITKEVEFS